MGGHFEKYMQVTMSMLVQASSTAIDASNPELIDYLNLLREGIFEAYTGVLQGLRADDKSSAFEPYVMGALDLIRQVAEGIPAGTTGDDVLRAATGVVGDLGSSLGTRGLKTVARQSPHREYLKVRRARTLRTAALLAPTHTAAPAPRPRRARSHTRRSIG